MALSLDNVQHVTFDRQIIHRVLIPEWVAASGKQCIYATGFKETALGAQANWYWGSGNPDIMVQLARTATSGGTIASWSRANARLYQEDFFVEHLVHNTSTARIKVIGYLCKNRKDQGRPDPGGAVTNSVYRFPTEVLGNGFRDNGIGSGVGEENEGMDLPQFTPFDSPIFCKTYSIMKITTRIVEPGEYAKFRIRDGKTRRVFPEEYQMMQAATDTWNDIDTLTFPQVYEHKKTEMFWLFKLMTDTIGEVKDSESNVPTMDDQEVYIETMIKYKGKLVNISAFTNIEYGLATAVGFTVPGGFTVETINPKTEEKNDMENL